MTQKDARIVLEGESTLSSDGKTAERVHLKLTVSALESQSQNGQTSICFRDVIGCRITDRKGRWGTESGIPSSVTLFSYTVEGRNGAESRKRRTHRFDFDLLDSEESNRRQASDWHCAILWAMAGHFQETEGTHFLIPRALPPKRTFLCIVNPGSGFGRSLEIFVERVKPMLEEADISHTLIVTERVNHAREFVHNEDITGWSAIIVISGDGLLHEVYNGIMDRADSDVTVKIPIGIIPGGSGNGLARSVCHASDEPYLVDPILACTFLCVKGQAKPLDLCEIRMPERESVYSFLSFGWGIMSDIDIESEKLRFLGEIRFTLWAFWRILNLKTYAGRIWYRPAQPKTSTAQGCDDNEARSLADAETEDDWHLEEGRFVIIYSSLVSHLGTKLFFAPKAQLDDGVCWLMTMKGQTSRRQILSYFINQEKGKHVGLPWIKTIPVSAFKLQSFDECYVTIDGEQFHTRTVEAEVLSSKARILSL